MSSLLTFVIPVRHYKNAHDWDGVKRRLSETILSIAQQQEGCSWKAVIVANSGADLPELPPRFEVAYVDFPRDDLYLRWSDHSDEEVHEAVRRDKGRRALVEMLQARDSGYFMVVDDDVGSAAVRCPSYLSTPERTVGILTRAMFGPMAVDYCAAHGDFGLCAVALIS